MNANLYALLQSRFCLNRSQTALETASGSIYSYAMLEDMTARYAGFISALGVVPGDRIAVQVEKSPEALFLYLACLQSGAVFLPLNSAYQEVEVDYFLGDATPKVVLHQPKSDSWMRALCGKHQIAHRYMLSDDSDTENQQGRHSWHENASKASPMLEIVHRDHDDLAAILYTSGTTGRSKGAMITHKNLASNALTLHAYWGFKPGDILLHALPIFHVHGLFVACHTALLNASKMIFHSKFDVKQAIEVLPRATVFMGVPTMYVRLLSDATFAKETCANMRLFVSGSAPLLAETFHAFLERTGHVILERYGMTETGMITSNPLGGDRRGGTVGLPLPGVALRVVDDDGRACVAGDIGGLQVKGDNVLPGYWQMPDKNKEEFTNDGYFKTGDIGKIDVDGYVTIVGRARDLVISGGYNVYPKEIEMLLDEIVGVAESAVIGLPHADFGEAVAAVLVRKPGATLAEPDILAAIKGKLAAFKLPKRIFVVDDLPRNAMGKVQKNELRKRYADTFR
ncbi:MAG: malonyl-CoA synthase [Burkholderiales bacterium]|nr:malonyl-CoA synthase [Burkholderiales bacterium]